MSSFKQIVEEFKVPKEGKISDKTFMYNLVASIVGLVLCLFFLSATTFAWYSQEISAGSMNIASSSCVVEIKVAYDSDPGSDGEVYDAQDYLSAADSNSNDIVYKYNFAQDVVYKVTLSSVGDGTGYCKMKIGDTDTYYFSEQIPNGSAVTFYITFDTDTSAEFYSCWGYYSGENRDIFNEGHYSYTAEDGFRVNP